MFNNINMKKKLIIVLISIMLLTGCAKKVGNKDYHIVEKNLKIDDNCEVLYPTIDEIIDESLKELNFNKENILPSILNKTQNIMDIANIEPSCLSIIYNLIFIKVFFLNHILVI